MTAKEQLQKRVATLTEEEAERALHALDSEPRAMAKGGRDESSEGRRLSFFAVGDGSADNASERVEELVGAAITRRQRRPAS